MQEINAIKWDAGSLILLDQRKLPHTISEVCCNNSVDVSSAITEMVVRGAPAIGIAAAYAVVLSAQAHQSTTDMRARVLEDIELLSKARPTAVNLHWALKRMRACLGFNTDELIKCLLEEAQAIHQEDIAANKNMAEHGASFIKPDSVVLTHCNTGALATGAYGTALGVIRSAFQEGSIRQVYATETRPWLQGSRLTAWELQQDAIPVKILCDSAAASLMHTYAVDWVIVGADRVAANGDVANKIGTYALASLAKQHSVSVMVVAPSSTVDIATPTGLDIPIEQRAAQEISHFAGQAVTTDSVEVWNPAFDITPAALIDVLVTENGAIKNPDQSQVLRIINR